MKQYKLPLTVNKGRRKRAAPISIDTVRFVGSGKYLLTIERPSHVRVYEVNSGKEIIKIQTINCVAATSQSDGDSIRHIVTVECDTKGYNDWNVKYYTFPQGSIKRTLSLRGISRPLFDVAFSPDLEYLATAEMRRNASEIPPTEITIWSLSSGAKIRSLRGHEGSISSIAFSQDGKLLVSGAKDSMVKLWNISSGQEIKSYLLRGNYNDNCEVAFSNSGKLIAAGGHEGFIMVYNPSDRISKRFKGHTKWIGELAFHPNNSLLASASSDNTVRVWRLANDTPLIRSKATIGSRVRVAARYAVVIGISVYKDTNMVLSGFPNRKRRKLN